MSNRDELQALVHDALTHPQHGEFALDSRRAAARILAAGWRPPARTIETREDLLKLERGVVIIDRDGDVLVADPATDGDEVFFRQIDEPWPLSSTVIALPATVLHEPKG